MEETVKVTDEQVKEANRLENNPEMMLRLIDLLFLGREDKRDIPS